MFEILPNPSLETVLIAGRAVALIGAFWVFAVAFTRWRRADERDSEALRDQLERAFNEMRSLHETVTVMSARIEAMSERAETDSRRSQLPAVVATGQARGYDLALRMAKNGSSVEDLVANCGITRHEAELLTRLHAAKSQPEVAAWQARQQASQPQQVSQVMQQQPQSTGRKRGSLLSVVG
jgi:hypothetical protein